MSDRILKPRLIRASAGTGKTRELSSRYIGLLACGESPDRILATTFTRKAAAEIRERIFSRLSRASQEPAAATELGESIDRPGFRCDDARQLLKGLVDQQHRLLITTLDSLFIAMAQSFALELGLPVDWKIGSERDGALLREEAVRTLFEQHSGAVSLEMVRLIHGGTLSRSVHQRVTGDVERLYRYFLFTDASAWEWVTVPETPPASVQEELEKLLEAYQIPLTSSGAPNKNTQKMVEKLRSIQRHGDWKAFGQMSVAGTALDGSYLFYGKPVDDQLKRILDWLLGEARRAISVQLRLRLRGVYLMLSRYHEQYRETQKRLGILTFDDVKQQLAVSSITGELEPLYYRLDSRISHLLLDEFQDTSMNEWRVLQPIADEILSRPEERSFFCVGDMKQAIYGWRGGVAEIFGSIESRWDFLKPESRQTTYRCAPAIIECVNHVFESLHEATCLDPDRAAVMRWQDRFESHEAARKELQGQVMLHRLNPAEDRSSFTVELVTKLQQQYPQASIGVLVRRNQTVSALLSEFAARQPGMAVSEEGAVQITDSSLVRVLLSLFRFIDHPADTLARYHIEQTDVASLLKIPLEDAGQLDLWRREVQIRLVREGYGAVSGAWARLLASSCRELDRARLQQLVDQAYLYDAGRTLCADDFVRHIESVKVEQPSEASIRVMSLHKAKGLEFDVVVLPELEGQIDIKADEILVGQRTPIHPIEKVALGPGNSFERALIPDLAALWRTKRDASVVEMLSLLYVGLTRPRQALHLVLPAQDELRGVSPAHLLSQVFPEESRETVLFGSEAVQISPEKAAHTPQRLFAAQKIRFSATGAGRAPRLDRITPSQHRDRLVLHSPEEISSGHLARDTGVALHLLFEQIGWLEDFSLESLDPETLAALLPAGDSGRVLTRFSALLESPVIRQELSRVRFAGELRPELMREQRFALRRESHLVVGAIDRMVVQYRGDKPVAAEITDYKSDRLNGGALLESKVEQYRVQLQRYAEAAKSLLGAEVAVTAKLLFLDGPQVRMVIEEEGR